MYFVDTPVELSYIIFLSMETKHANVTGAILAFGKSSLIHSGKALILYKGVSFIQHIADVVNSIYISSIIISDKESYYRSLVSHVFSDIHKDCGPKVETVNLGDSGVENG